MAQDPSTSDDSGRASERLISSSSVAPRDADSSRDRLSDVSVTRWQSEFTLCNGAAVNISHLIN